MYYPKVFCWLGLMIFLLQDIYAQSFKVHNLSTNQHYQANENIVICPDNVLALETPDSEIFHNKTWKINGILPSQYQWREEKNGKIQLTFHNINPKENYTSVSIELAAQNDAGQAVAVSRKCIVLGQCLVKDAVILGSPDAADTSIYYNAFPPSSSRKYWVVGNLQLESIDTVQPHFDIINQHFYIGTANHSTPPRISTHGNLKPISLNIRQSVFAAANHWAWDGLYLSGKARLRLHETLFADSREGVVCRHASQDTASHITNCFFSNNYMSVQVLQSPAHISQTDFVADAARMPHLSDRKTDALYADCFVRSRQPFKGFYQNTFDGAIVGVELQNAKGNIWIGEPNKGGNIFRNIFLSGIYSTNTDYQNAPNTLKLYDCAFYFGPFWASRQLKNARQMHQIKRAANYGLYCLGNTQIDWTGAGHNIFQSPNLDCHELEHIGVYTEDCPKVNIEEFNQFVHLSEGVQLTGKANRYVLKTNTFIECKIGIHLEKQAKEVQVLWFGNNAFVKKWETPYFYNAALLEGLSPIVSDVYSAPNMLGSCMFVSMDEPYKPLENLVMTDLQENKLAFDKRTTPKNYIFINNQLKYMDNIMPLTYYVASIDPLLIQRIPSRNAYIQQCTNSLLVDDNIGVMRATFAAPTRLTSLQNSPNPANNSTLVSYELSENLTEMLDQNPVRLQIRDVTGKLWYEQNLTESNANLELNTAQWPSGIYLASLLHNGKVLAKHKIAIQK